jgi:hypothetical protein
MESTQYFLMGMRPVLFEGGRILVFDWQKSRLVPATDAEWDRYHYRRAYPGIDDEEVDRATFEQELARLNAPALGGGSEPGPYDPTVGEG